MITVYKSLPSASVWQVKRMICTNDVATLDNCNVSVQNSLVNDTIPVHVHA